MDLKAAQIHNLTMLVRRITALPITAMTLRELQNAIVAVSGGAEEQSKALHEALFKGVMPAPLEAEAQKALDELLRDYGYQVRLAQEVYEFGEYLNTMTCDIVSQGNKVSFLLRIRRIDGTEYHCICTPDIGVRMAHMLLRRLHDLKNATEAKALDPHLGTAISQLKPLVEELLQP